MASVESPWITSFYGTLLKLSIARKGDNEFVDCQIRSYVSANVKREDGATSVIDDSNQCFKEERSISLALNNCKHSCIVSTAVSRDNHTGTTRPYMLIQSTKSADRTLLQCVGVFYFSDTSDPSLASSSTGSDSSTKSGRFYLRVVSQFSADSNNYLNTELECQRIIDGPSAFWIDTSERRFCHLRFESDKAQLSFSGLGRIKPHNLKILGWSSLSKAEETIVLCSGIIDNDLVKLFAVVVVNSGTDSKLFQLKAEDVGSIIPQEYGSILNCVLLSRIEVNIKIDLISADTRKPNVISSHSHVFAATTQKHLLEFHSGRLVRCVDIDSASVTAITPTLAHSLEPHLTLFSPEDRLIMGIQCQDLQTKVCHRGVDHVTVDDYLGCGSEQALGVSLHPPTWPPTAWVITDYGPTLLQYPPDKDGVGSVAAGPQTASRLTAVQALRARLQSDLIHLRELKRDSCEREALIDTACETVRCLTTGQNPQPQEQADLVLLCGSDVPSGHMTKNLLAVGQKWLEVKDTWQRSFDGQWVVGVDVLNLSQRDMESLTLSACLPSHVGLEKDHQTSKSVWPVGRRKKPSHHSQEDGCGDWVHEPTSAKRARVDNLTDSASATEARVLRPGCDTTVLCVLSQPMFGVDTHDSLLLWLRFRPSEKISDTAEDASAKITMDEYTIFCGRIHFSKDDLFGGKHCINLRCPSSREFRGVERWRSRVSMDACQQRLALTVLTTPDRSDALTSDLSSLALTPHPTFECHLCPEGVENLRNVRIEVAGSADKPSASLVIFTRDIAQLWSTLHFLYHLLPDDVVLAPSRQCEPTQFDRLRQFHNNLQTEIRFTLSQLTRMLQEQVPDDDEDVVAMETDNAGSSPHQSATVREDFARLQRRFHNDRREGVVPFRQYRMFLDNLRTHRQVTDESLLQLLFS